MDLFQKQPRKTYSIEYMREIAAARNGRCLSDQYRNERVDLAWSCDAGHEWLAKPRAIIRQGTWCPVCAIAKRRDNRLYTVNTRHKANLNDLDQVKDFARRLGGEYLSGYMPKDSDEKVQWRCKQGHIWFASLALVTIHGFWCPECVGKDLILRPRDISLELLQKVAANRNGHLISEQSTGSVNELLEWECSCGHRWRSSARIVTSQRRWCPTCESEIGEIHFSFRHSIQELKQYAKAMGGECLAQSYTGMREPIEWACAKGHHWTTTAVSVLSNNHWCPECAVERRSTAFTLADIQKVAHERGGECLSSEYHGLMDKLEWRCAQNHVWTASFKSVYYTGRWCSTCANYRKKKFDIHTIQEASSAHGWKCLSTSYERVREPLHFECAAGHQVTITFSKALASDFHCPKCKRSDG